MQDRSLLKIYMYYLLDFRNIMHILKGKQIVIKCESKTLKKGPNKTTLVVRLRINLNCSSIKGDINPYFLLLCITMTIMSLYWLNIHC